MSRIEAALIALFFLIFLFPLGVYLLALATINRRERPVLISGTWDAIMLSAGLAGVLLGMGPALLGTFHERGLLPGGGDQADRHFEQIWEMYPWVWIAYYVLVVAGQLLMIVSRRDKTVVYNVDADALRDLIVRTFEDKGFRTSLSDELILFERISSGDGGQVSAADRGAVDLESFPGFRHATLHWHTANNRLRRTIENEVNSRLLEALTDRNPAATWLLGVSGLIFGFVFLGAVYIILLGMRGRGF